jgi:hypothetical protein
MSHVNSNRIWPWVFLAPLFVLNIVMFMAWK